MDNCASRFLRNKFLWFLAGVAAFIYISVNSILLAVDTIFYYRLAATELTYHLPAMPYLVYVLTLGSTMLLLFFYWFTVPYWWVDTPLPKRWKAVPSPESEFRRRCRPYGLSFLVIGLFLYLVAFCMLWWGWP